MHPRLLLLALVAAALYHAAAQVTDFAVVVRTDKELRSALEITSVNRIFVAAGLTFLDANWPATPLVINRSVTISSLPNTSAVEYPLLNFGGLLGRVVLAGNGTTFAMERLAVTALRPGVLIAVAPGMNLFGISVSSIQRLGMRPIPFFACQ